MKAKQLKEGLADLAYKAESDHEVQMARAELYKIAKYAIKMHEMLKGVEEREGLEGWVQSKITKAADYMGSVYHHMDYEQKFDEVQEAKQTTEKYNHDRGSKKKKKEDIAKEGKMPQAAIDALAKKNGKSTKKDSKKDVQTEDLALMAHKAEMDHEVQMARSDLYKAAKYSIKLHERLKGISEEQGLEGWVAAKITKASDYLSSVFHYMDYEMMSSEEMTESRTKIVQAIKTKSEQPEPTYKETISKKYQTKLDEVSKKKN